MPTETQEAIQAVKKELEYKDALLDSLIAFASLERTGTHFLSFAPVPDSGEQSFGIQIEQGEELCKELESKGVIKIEKFCSRDIGEDSPFDVWGCEFLIVDLNILRKLSDEKKTIREKLKNRRVLEGGVPLFELDVRFDKGYSRIYIGDSYVQLATTKDTDEYYLCEKIFRYTPHRLILAMDIYEAMQGKNTGKDGIPDVPKAIRLVKDTCRRINKKVQNEIGTKDDLFDTSVEKFISRNY